MFFSFDETTYPVQLLPSLVSIRHATQTRWNIPEADICVLGLWTVEESNKKAISSTIS